MAITVLGGASSPLGSWQIDYDDVGLTVGHTCDTSDPNATLVLTVTRVSDSATFTRDVTADFGQGRIVDLSGVPNGEVPPHVKGTVYPFLFGGTWTP